MKRKLIKSLWKHKGKIAVAGGVAGATGSAFAVGVKTGLGLANYNPGERERLKALKDAQEEEFNKINSKLNNQVNDYVRKNKL